MGERVIEGGKKYKEREREGGRDIQIERIREIDKETERGDKERERKRGREKETDRERK